MSANEVHRFGHQSARAAHSNATSTVAAGRTGALIFSTLVLCAAFGEVSTGLLVPAMPSLGKIYNRPPETIQLTISSFAIMFAIGQLLFGPFSDRRGRRTALLLGAVLTLAGSMTAAMADSVSMIIGGRAIQGLGAAAGYVVARAIIRDIYGPESLLHNGGEFELWRAFRRRGGVLRRVQATYVGVVLPFWRFALAFSVRRTESRCSFRRLWTAAWSCHSPRQSSRPRMLKRPAS